MVFSLKVGPRLQKRKRDDSDTSGSSADTSSSQKKQKKNTIINLEEEEQTEALVEEKSTTTVALELPKEENVTELTEMQEEKKISWNFILLLSIKRKRLVYIVMVAYYLALFNEGTDLATWRILSSLNSGVEDTQKEALDFAEYYVKPFTQLVPSHLPDSDIKQLHTYLHNQHISYCDNSGTYEFSCQFYVFHLYTGTLLYKVPDQFDSSLRQLYFSAESDDTGDLKNISIIQNLLAFFRMFGVFCFFCEKFFRGHGTQHKCPKTASCFACRRPLLTSRTYITKKTKSLFCDGGIAANTANECPKCNMRLLTSDCARHHNQRVCRWGVLCQKCDTYIYVSKFVAKNKVLESHVCGLHQCYFCGLAEKKSEHVCKINLPKIDNNFTNLGFLNFEFSGQSPLKCIDCFKDNSVCGFCSDNINKNIVVCDALIETTERGQFESFTFAPFKNVPKNNSLKKAYFPANFPLSLGKRSKTKFGKSTKKVIVSALFETSGSPIEKLFATICSKKITNTTFILLDDTRNCFEEIIKCLYDHGIRPVVLGSPRIFLVEVPCLDVRFINFENYVDDTFTDILNRFCTKGDIKYFPRHWIKETFFEFIGKAPVLSDLQEYYDTEEIIQDKKRSMTLFNTPWNFSVNLLKYSFSKCSSLAQAALEFVEESFQCQEQLKKNFSHTTPDCLVHPFNKPLFTKASYSYKLMCLFCEDMQRVRIVKPAIAMQSSRGELEFCSYTKWLNPSLHIQTAWSPRGQKHFPESFPDYYIPETKTCGYWNGCLVHGHPSDLCTFKKHALTKKNMFKVNLTDAFLSYEKKKKKLLENRPEEVQVIQEMWHCEWIRKKATDSKLQNFLKHIYRNPPLYRLEARAAGEF